MKNKIFYLNIILAFVLVIIVCFMIFDEHTTPENIAKILNRNFESFKIQSSPESDTALISEHREIPQVTTLRKIGSLSKNNFTETVPQIIPLFAADTEIIKINNTPETKLIEVYPIINLSAIAIYGTANNKLAIIKNINNEIFKVRVNENIYNYKVDTIMDNFVILKYLEKRYELRIE